MTALPAEFKLETVPLGEIRMGCEGYAVRLSNGAAIYSALESEIVLVGHDNIEKVSEVSRSNEYLRIKGEFGHYFFCFTTCTWSVYELTVRGHNNEVSYENAIYGQEKTHIKGFSRHYYLQFPFVADSEFGSMLKSYKSFRASQIEAATNAI